MASSSELLPLLVDVVLESPMPRLRSLKGLSWPAFSRLCKADVELPLTDVGFGWGPGEHVVRRLRGSTALPNLRRLATRCSGADARVGQLFEALAQWGRPLESMLIVTRLRLADPCVLRLRARWVDQRIVVEAEGDTSDWDGVVSRCLGFGLPPPTNHVA